MNVVPFNKIKLMLIWKTGMIFFRKISVIAVMKFNDNKNNIYNLKTHKIILKVIKVPLIKIYNWKLCIFHCITESVVMTTLIW